MSPEKLLGFEDSYYFQVVLPLSFCFPLSLFLACGSASCPAPSGLLLAASAAQQWILTPLEPESKINCHFFWFLVFYHGNRKVTDTSGGSQRREKRTGYCATDDLLKAHGAKLPSKYLHRHPWKLLSAWPLKLLLMQSH